MDDARQGLDRRRAPARVAAGVAAALGVASAAITTWWIAGGTVLLDTVGGAFEQLARERSVRALLLGVGVVLAKLVAAALGPAVLRWPHRWIRVPALLAGAVLTLWGGANVVLGGAVLIGVLDLGPVADERALRWHVVFWDLWFLVWGLALLAAVLLGQRGGAVDPRSTSTGSTSSARPRG